MKTTCEIMRNKGYKYDTFTGHYSEPVEFTNYCKQVGLYAYRFRRV